MSLFQKVDFMSAAGLSLDWRIECDALTERDWECIAHVGMKILPAFRNVLGVPRGGLKLEKALLPHCSDRGPLLLVDDVWSTGKSMRKLRDEIYKNAGLSPEDNTWIGFVAFARGPLLANVKCFMQVGG